MPPQRVSGRDVPALAAAVEAIRDEFKSDKATRRKVRFPAPGMPCRKPALRRRWPPLAGGPQDAQQRAGQPQLPQGPGSAEHRAWPSGPHPRCRGRAGCRCRCRCCRRRARSGSHNSSPTPTPVYPQSPTHTRARARPPALRSGLLAGPGHRAERICDGRGTDQAQGAGPRAGAHRAAPSPAGGGWAAHR